MNSNKRSVTAAQRWTLALASVGSFVVVLDLLVVATALTAIQRDLHASIEDLEWTINAYTLSFAALLMTASSLGDRFGRRRVFVAGLTLFAVASAACALAPSTGTLIAARAVQGIGAATVMPLALALLNAAFPPERRGWALGIYGSVTGLAVLLGPVLGGVITEGLAWQWIFWLNVPVGLAAIPFVLARIKEGFGQGTAMDFPGLLLFTLAAFGLVWGLVRADAAGWGSVEVTGALAGGTVLVVVFLVWQSRARTPMLPLRLFRSRAFSAGNAVMFLLSGSMSASVFFIAQYQQVTLGQGPLGAGLRLLPWGTFVVLLASRTGALADRWGERSLVVAGLALQTIGTAWIALIAAPHLSYRPQVIPLSLAGIGFALAIPAVTKAVVSTSAPADIGKASGAYSTMRQLGGAFGVAITAAVFAATGGYASAAAFSDGFGPAMAVAAGFGVAATLAGTLLPPSRRPALRAPTGAPAEADRVDIS
ncbi:MULTISPECIES: MFS transporter [unclassified Streptomyces]|uniref:MFS transporter n=1 Tax=unclassified Streptomyces TaxID=2593676 RepID=UPI001164CFB9|nr:MULTISPECIES: MFS transporter [unclassified Streptomyces]QDN54401.1 MFS transporter [Streptomyces sp. S1D4-20]QDN64584.1 MFS transporter [Streptomyces sp. S1D4-14]QDO46991.1 MFS transporter [Streptomyces sp. RLB3-5]QDO57233.1 MFS transporter [Streptomyces sp. RLB1-8]